MKKVIIHIEEIKSRQAKIQFQVKLPVTCKCITGLLATISPNTEHIPVEGEDPRVENAGSLWLRIPECRDVFYAEDVKEYNHLQKEFHTITQPILTTQPQWWFSGWKRDFFTTHVAIEETILEGYYVDETPPAVVSYLLRIYIELQIND